MPLRFEPGEPENGRELAVAGIARLAERRGCGLDARLCASRPHRSFECTLAGAVEDVVAGARFDGWRYLIFQGKDCVGAAVVRRRPEDPAAVLSSVAFDGDFAEQLRELDWLAERTEQEPAEYELRFLRVPGLAVATWWLRRGAGGEGELFVPVPPSQKALRPRQHTLYEGAESFSRVVRELAREKQTAAAVLFAGLPGGSRALQVRPGGSEALQVQPDEVEPA
jgi:hypothetical protein